MTCPKNSMPLTITLARHRFLAKRKPKSARTSGSEPRRFNLSLTPYYSLLAMHPHVLTTHAYSQLFPAEPLQEPIESVPIDILCTSRLDLALSSARMHLLCLIQYTTEEERLCVQPRQKIGRRLITLSYFDLGGRTTKTQPRGGPPTRQDVTTNITRYRCSSPRSSHFRATPWMILAMAWHGGMALRDET